MNSSFEVPVGIEMLMLVVEVVADDKVRDVVIGGSCRGMEYPCDSVI